MEKNVEAIYPLTPMQQGLLLHTLQASGPEGSGAPASGADPGTLHLRGRLEGPLDPDALAEAWRQATRRHPALRTVLRWEGLAEPLQIVLRSVDVPWTVEDWRAHRPVRQQELLDAYLAADLARGLDLRRPPTMRLALFRTGEAAWHHVWTCHHALLDGWSGALVLQDVVALYAAHVRGEPAALPPAPPFQHYVRWLKGRPEGEAEAFWRGRLAGVTGPTPLPFDPPEDAADLPPGHDRQEVELPADATAALLEVARRHRLTLSTLLYGAWAVLLSRRSGRETVVFGATSAGRAVDLPGVEAMAGMLINTLPIRVDVAPGASALAVCQELQAAQADHVRYGHCAPAQVQAWTDVPARHRLFESLLVIENYPRAAAPGGPLALRDVRGGITSNYPLTLLADPGERVRLHVVYDRRRFAQAAMTRLLYTLQELLEGIAEAPERPVGALLPEDAAGAGAAAAPADRVRDRGELGLGGYAPPRDAVERRLAAVWEDVLGVSPVGVDDGFFDLGGQSMQGLQLLNRVERAFGRKLPLALLLSAPSVSRMADVLRGGAAEEGPMASLVPLNAGAHEAGAHEAGGARPALFGVHSYDGQVLMYRDLARHLSPEQPLYGLQAVGLDGAAAPLERVEEMAARYVGEVRAVQPEGPYALLALCFGISVALEMARLLTEQGQAVSHLFVLDSSFKHLRKEREPEAVPTPRGTRLQRVLARLRSGNLFYELPAHVRVHGRKALAPARRLKESLERAVEGPQQRRIGQVTEANTRAWDRYRPTPYAGTVTLVRSSAWTAWGEKHWHIPVWAELARGGLEVHAVPGTHTDMLREPYVRALAALLQDLLDRSGRTPGPAGGDGHAPPAHRGVSVAPA